MIKQTNVIAGDIGGTKTHLAIFSLKGNLTQIYQKKYYSYEWKSIKSILDDFMIHIPNDITKPKFGCLAIAGRVENKCSTITNLGWDINELELSRNLKLESLEIINDFSVLSYGIPFLSSESFCEIQTAKNHTNGPIAILGAGTGLGITRSICIDDKIISLPSEGGHSEFSPRTNREWLFSQWLKNKLNINRLSIERVVSGTGLGYLASWRLSQGDSNRHPLKEASLDWLIKQSRTNDLPALVSEAATKGDQMMIEVLEIWIGAYGSVAGDLALQELSTGGLWIGGGTACKHINEIRSKTFLEAFTNKGRFKSFLEQIPIKALINPEVGLFSAACRARMLAKSNEKLN